MDLGERGNNGVVANHGKVKIDKITMSKTKNRISGRQKPSPAEAETKKVGSDTKLKIRNNIFCIIME